MMSYHFRRPRCTENARWEQVHIAIFELTDVRIVLLENWPPEEYFRLGIRYDSRENYQKFGYISLDELYILRNDGEVYVLMDEDSLKINSDDVKNFEEHQRKEHHSMETRISDLEVLLKIILEGGLSPSTQIRLIRWWVCGRFGIDLESI